MMANKLTTTIFFLSLEDRPKDFPPLKNFKDCFWHCGIISESKIYECFNFGKWKISSLERKNDPEFKNAVYLETKIDTEKLTSEIKSGTDCAEFVARCANLSNLNGSSKGDLWPEDVYNLLQKKHGPF